MTDQPRDEVNRYARLDPIARALFDDHDAIALAELLVKAHDELASARAALIHNDWPAGTRWLHIELTSPHETTANTSALVIADHLAAEFPGIGMRISSNAVEGGPDFTGPLTGIEVRDPCPWCESSPTLIPRQLMAEHVATVHPEVRTGGPGIPVADVESVIVCTTACDEQHTYDWTCELFAGISDEPPRTTLDNSPTSEDEADNPAATEATSLQTRVTGLYEQWVKAGPPPLGVSTARWWDRRLVELHHAIRPPAEQPARTTVNNPAGA